MAVKAYSLTTGQRAADFLGLGTVTGAKLTRLELLCDTVTEFVEKYIGYRVKLTAYTNQVYDTPNGETINLKHYPISSSASFSMSFRESQLNEDDWEEVDSDKYFVDYSSGIVKAPFGFWFRSGRQKVRFSYSAGYDFDNSVTFLSDTEGGDLELAAWLLISSLYHRSRGGGGISSERIGDYSVTYRQSLFENDDIKGILDKYANVELGGILTPMNT